MVIKVYHYLIPDAKNMIIKFLSVCVHLQVIMYTADRVYDNYYPTLKGRVHFNSLDPKNGDASITLMGLIASDTGTYQCKVKKVPGIGSKKVLLTVMGKCTWQSHTHTRAHTVQPCPLETCVSV